MRWASAQRLSLSLSCPFSSFHPHCVYSMTNCLTVFLFLPYFPLKRLVRTIPSVFDFVRAMSNLTDIFSKAASHYGLNYMFNIDLFISFWVFNLKDHLISYYSKQISGSTLGRLYEFTSTMLKMMPSWFLSGRFNTFMHYPFSPVSYLTPPLLTSFRNFLWTRWLEDLIVSTVCIF